MSENVLADAQYGIGRLLRPFSTFKSIYEGQDCKKPIQFTEGGIALADEAAAGAAGFDPKLLRGVDVPYGANIRLYLPAIVPTPLWDATSTQSVGYYRYFLIWRLRNIVDYRSRPSKQDGYHSGKQATGVADSGARFFDLAVFSVSSYAGSEPSGPATTTVDTAYPLAKVTDTIQTIRVNASSQTERGTMWPYVPLLPDGNDGHYQQGVIGTAPTMNKYTPSYIVHNTCAFGDELLIGLFRDAPANNTDPTVNVWTFGGDPDEDLADFLTDSNENGIYLFTGTQ